MHVADDDDESRKSPIRLCCFYGTTKPNSSTQSARVALVTLVFCNIAQCVFRVYFGTAYSTFPSLSTFDCMLEKGLLLQLNYTQGVMDEHTQTTRSVRTKTVAARCLHNVHRIQDKAAHSPLCLSASNLQTTID